MAGQPQTGLTYEDLQAFPEDGLRREIIGGELFMTAAPIPRHQLVVATLVVDLGTHCRANGGRIYPGPIDVYFSSADVVEPDLIYLSPQSLEKVEMRFVRSAPDLVVEVSSPSTRRVDQGRKRELYQRYGVPEYWFVDLDADRVEVHRLEGDRYPPPTVLTRTDTLGSPLLPGFALSIEDLLGPPEN
jgi:Uma2 family endonuclease